MFDRPRSRAALAVALALALILGIPAGTAAARTQPEASAQVANFYGYDGTCAGDRGMAWGGIGGAKFGHLYAFFWSEELRDLLKAGDRDGFTAAILAKADARIDAAVASGKISEDCAAELKSAARMHLERVVERIFAFFDRVRDKTADKPATAPWTQESWKTKPASTATTETKTTQWTSDNKWSSDSDNKWTSWRDGSYRTTWSGWGR